ncbi:MAG: DNA polymerase I [Deltaproteobacteria bacterium]|nr:DNA polymerase I [Candidatus Zymogenaceae bacterium]
MSRKTIALIDGSSYIYRAFYAIRGLATSGGFPTGAIFGFNNMLTKVLDDLNPDYVAVAFDAKGPTFRKEIYDDYKANRPEMPDDLKPQIPKIKELLDAYNITHFELEGYEADDIIGTVVADLPPDCDAIIITGDKDMAQLVSDRIRLLDTMKDTSTDLDAVQQKYGVTGDGLLEVFGLSGDTSDNIPGVPGIGEKTAVDLIKKYGSIEEIFSHIDDFSGKRRENLEQFRDQAALSKKLFTIKKDVPITFNIDAAKRISPDTERLANLFRELDFHTLLKKLEDTGGGLSIPFETVLDEKRLSDIVEQASKAPLLSVDTETTSTVPMQAELVGVSLCFDDASSYYIPLAHRYLGVPKQIDRDTALSILKPLLENPRVPKAGQNIKYDYIVLARYGIHINPIAFDTMVASYLINPSRRGHSLDAISLEYLQHRPIGYKDVAGSGKHQLTFDQVEIETASEYAAEDAYLVYRLVPILTDLMEARSVRSLFRDLEMPLLTVLARMEMAGVRVDRDILGALSVAFSKDIATLEGKIIDQAGEPFNVNSTKQLATILFEKMGITPVKKTKTGYSTDNDVLTVLSAQHPIAEDILQYRSLAKLKSTYVDALAELINPDTGRIHTSYNQTVAATGRLSSSDPNLQNIPIRTAEGRRIREAFVPKEGFVLLSADYSQIELRLLAHFSKDSGLTDAFLKGEDVHASTASLIFGVDPKDITSDMRRKAKTINFGIIYGISAFGLSQQLGIGRDEAAAFIDSYFEKFSHVKQYMDGVIEQARHDGYVTTIMDRRRYLPELKSSDRNVRSFAERMAINTPVQGSAADLIKRAMITLDRRLTNELPDSRMIIQVHDELVLEVPEERVEKTVSTVREEMEGALELSVPIVVDIHTGTNWSEAH